MALYGDLLEEQDWIGHKGIKLFDAAIYPNVDKEVATEEDIINNIKDQISRIK